MSFENGIFSEEFTACKTVQIISHSWHGWSILQPECMDGPAPHETLTQCKVDLNDLVNSSYFRCQIIDGNGCYE